MNSNTVTTDNEGFSEYPLLTERISVRYSKEEIEKISEIKKIKHFRSFSQTVRYLTEIGINYNKTDMENLNGKHRTKP